MNLHRILLFLVTLLTTPQVALGDEGGGVEFFEKRIRPVLIRHCYECHSAASSELKGELRLDSRDLTHKGGKSGPAIVPGNTEKSLLLGAIRHESFEMPPGKKLPDKVIADFVKWIEIGAPDPRDRPPSVKEVAELSWKAVLDERRHWWSLQSVSAAEPPVTRGVEAEHPIDAFISAKLQAAGMKTTNPAGARVLARRLSLVLTGLPPAPAEVEQFAKDHEKDPDAAYEVLVDRLLSSQHFGEHWARHWMDVVRFAETHGYEWNHEVRDAWRYRDYLIRAFNNDVPYDQLVREHIAGDLLESPRVNERLGINESIIGTAYWRFGELGHDDCVNFPEIRFDALDNQIDTFSKAFQALTISCARCHDHKLDAISTKDYYALVGVLESCSQVVHTIDSPRRIADAVTHTQQLKTTLRRQLAKQWLATIDRSGKAILSAISDDDGDGTNSSPLKKHVADEKLGLADPGYVLSRLARRDRADADIASLWQELETEYTAEQTRRAKSNVENFEAWVDFGASETSGWSASGLGFSSGPSRAGEFTLTHEGDQVVAAILPGGLYTNVTSDRLNGSLRSPWLPTEKKFISVQLVGDRHSMVRTVVDSCALNEFAGGGLEYLDGGEPKWKRFPTSAGGSHRSFVELTTRSDNPRWPDRPGRADTNDPKGLQSHRSSFGVIRAVLHDSPTEPLPDLKPVLALFEQSRPSDKAGVAAVFQTVALDAVTAWKEERASDADVNWINWFLKVGLIPNSASGDQQLGKLLKQYRTVVSSIPEPRVIAGLADQASGNDFPVLQGGDPLNRGAVVPRRYIEVIAADSQPFGTTGSGRRQLAELIASSDNPLTARVMVNRIWHHLLGRGIVVTTDDFGRMGEKPTHPQLLDYLAAGLVKDDWSIKRLIRRIVLSKTFQQSSLPDHRAVTLDPGNRLLHHYPAHRLEAESIRDTILAVSGRLDAKMYGPSIDPHRKEEKDYRKLFIGPLDGAGRRSIYIKVTRMEGPQFLELFDFPNPMATRGRRDRTNVPAQALALLNDPFVIDQARFWSEQLVSNDDDSIEERVQGMFRQALGRAPSENEQQRLVTLIRQLAGETSADDTAIMQDKSVWQDTAHAVFNMKEVIYIQ